MNKAETSEETTRRIVVEYDLPHAPAKVWRALTEPGLLAAWLMPNDMRAEVGHHFTFRTQPMPGFDGVVECDVLIVEPQRRLRYSWRGGAKPADGVGYALNTVVTWTLTPTPGGGTGLRLDHEGFTLSNDFPFQTMGKGWRGHVGASLARVLNETA
ncbi:MAG: hypothetical protein NVS4B8_16570 [Herpetosiphon sp.]